MSHTTTAKLAAAQVQAYDIREMQETQDVVPEDSLDASCGCILLEDGQRGQPIICTYCACSYHEMRVCRGCNATGMMFVACTHGVDRRMTVPRTVTGGGSPHGGGSGRGPPASGSGGRRRTAHGSGNPRAVPRSA